MVWGKLYYIIVYIKLDVSLNSAIQHVLKWGQGGGTTHLLVIT